MSQSSSTLKKLSLELGGNAPYIVFDDGDVDYAIEAAMAAKYRGSGQVCVSPNRFFVQEGVYDEFCEKLAAKVKSIYQPGGGFNLAQTSVPSSMPLLLRRSLAMSRTSLLRMVRFLPVVPLEGVGRQLFPATVLSDVTNDMLVSQEETFGPVVSITKFATEEEVIERANAVSVGLASYFFTKDAGRGYRVADALDTGMIGHNTSLISEAALPFGGIKESGFGREGSKYGIEEYLVLKTVIVDIAH